MVRYCVYLVKEKINEGVVKGKTFNYKLLNISVGENNLPPPVSFFNNFKNTKAIDWKF